MSRKKVLMVSCRGLGRGGVQAVMMTILRGMQKTCDFDMLVFTKDPAYYDEQVLSLGGKLFRIPFYTGGNWLRSKLDYYIRGQRIYAKLCDILREQGPYDIIHCNNNYESALCLKAAKHCGVPIRIVHAHGNLRSGNILQKIYNGQYMKMIGRYATEKIACTPEAGKATFGTGDAKIIYNSYDEQRFDPQKHPAVQTKKMVLTQIASFSENKNQRFSIGVLEQLRKKNIPAELNLVGFGDYEAVLRREVAAKGLEDSVIFHTADADTPALLARSTAFLFPSHQEGFGIVLLEAQAMHVRCYVSDTVPIHANVGGCAFLPLEAGAAVWAERIAQDAVLGKVSYDCSAFTTDHFIRQIEDTYG